uniref:General transcription factor IIA, 1-like n=1 Tax=Neogobius melanostomus TaxID=47308 RepID=A0A8C6UT98_9GOBI
FASAPFASPQKPLQTPGHIKASVPRPNGLKLRLPSIKDTSWSFNNSLESPQSQSSFSSGSFAPCITPFCTPVSGLPSSASPFHSSSWESRGLYFPSTSAPSVSSPGSEADQEEERGDGERRLSCRDEVVREGLSQFVPRGLFWSQRRDGWSVMLRIPEKKNRMSSRQWGPIYLRLLPGGVLQMYYEKGLEKPFKEFQLLPQCRLSELKLESYGEPRKVLTVKVEHFSYTEKKRFHPKQEASREAEVEQLLKFGSTSHEDMQDLVVSMEEEIFQMCIPTSHAFTQIHCLAFLNGFSECFLALNDLILQQCNPSYESEEGSELWMEIADCHFHKCVNETEFHMSRLVKFTPPDACRVELMRFKTMTLGCTEAPFSVKAVVTVQGAYVELQAFLNMSPAFLTSGMGVCDSFPLCENVVIRVPVPGDWVKVTQTVALLRQRSLKARMNRNACLGTAGTANSQPVMQVSIGTVKYENVYSAIVWRIDRLPAKNTAVDHPHSFSCKLELGSDQEIPNDWYPLSRWNVKLWGPSCHRPGSNLWARPTTSNHRNTSPAGRATTFKYDHCLSWNKVMFLNKVLLFPSRWRWRRSGLKLSRRSSLAARHSDD